MLSQLEHLSREIDGRYASDSELTFAIDYVRSFNLRLQTYQKLQAIESTVIQQTQARMRAIDPNLFTNPKREDVTRTCTADMTYVWRTTALAVLLNDPDALQEHVLLWLQTIMRAFGKERICDMTYSILQEVVRQHLTPPQADLVCPMLELNRRILGTNA